MPQATKRPLFTTATANKARPLPKFQAPKSGPASSSAYLDQLDPLLKLNRGGFTAMGADAQSNIPFRVMGAEPIAVAEAADQAPLATVYNEGGALSQVENLPENPFTNTRQSVNPTIDQFMGYMDQVLESQGYGSKEAPNLPGAGANGIAQMQDGGVLFDDGMIRYDDGSEREYTGENATPIQSMADGSTRYSDNSVRRPSPTGIASVEGNRVRQSDGSYVNGPYLTGQGQSLPGGTRGLISGIFGQDRKITQDYGNINPMEPTVGNVNYGTDLRTKDLTGSQRELKLPVGATVVQVLKDDGTRFGDQSGHQGYGNSLLLRLPSGEMLRFSHLSQVLDVKEGDTINPGETFGIPGTTGNTDGEHLDLEYYNQNGQVSNPAQFSGFTNPQSILPNQPQPGTAATDPSQNMSRDPNAPASQSPQPQQNQEYTPSPMYQAAQKVAEAPAQAFNAVKEAAAPMSPQRQELGQNINELGAKAGLPEMYAGEVASGKVSPGEAVSYNIENANLTPRIDTGLSELARGDFQGAKTNFLDTAGRVGARLSRLPGEIASEVVKPAYADDGSQKPLLETLGQNFKGAADSVGNYISDKVGDAPKTIFSNAVEKPIEGINKLKSEFQSGVANIGQGLTDTLNKIGPKKAVGEESGGDQNILGAPQAAPGKNDIRDPFFKLGGAETYGKYLNNGAIGDGGLTLDLFNNDFFKDADAIANVLGSTHLLGGATDKYKANEATKYPKMGRMGYSDEYDSGSIDAYNKQVDEYNRSIDDYIKGINLSTPNATYGEAPRSTQSIIPGTNFSPNVSMSEQRAEATKGLFTNAFSPASRIDLSAPQMSMQSASKSPNMSMAMPSAPSKVIQAPNRSVAAPSPAKIQGSSATNSNYANYQPQMSVAPKAAVTQVKKSAPAPAKLQMSSATNPQAANYQPQMSMAPKAQTTPAKSGGTNIFSKAVNAVKKLFGR